MVMLHVIFWEPEIPGNTGAAAPKYAAAPLVLWVASLGLDELNTARSAWTGLGADFYYLPLALSVVGIIWMWRSNPRRIVSLAEQVERPNSPWKAG